MSKRPPSPQVYFDPTSDFGFKKLFGDEANKDILMDFLNSILPEDSQVSDLHFQNNEQIPDHEDDRRAIFDIFCISPTGESFIVEMQKASVKYFAERALYYTTFPIQKQAPKGRWDFNLSRVFLIAVLNFPYDFDPKRWKKRRLLRTCTLRDDDGVIVSDKLQFKFLQLAHFNKKPHQLKTHFDKWCYFLKNLDTFDVIPKILNEPIFMKASEKARVLNLSDAEYILYKITESKKYDWELVQEYAEERGMERGMEKGMEKGLELGKTEMAIAKDTEFVTSLISNTDFDDEKIALLANVDMSFVQDMRLKLAEDKYSEEDKPVEENEKSAENPKNTEGGKMDEKTDNSTV
jgi:predicted transposase/invertase (TIGR01784 family)